MSVAGDTIPTMVTPLQPSASRDEVLAAVEEHERQVRDYLMPEFPTVPSGFVGSVTSLDGSAIGCYGRRLPADPSLLRQAEAGEEDQSIPDGESD